MELDKLITRMMEVSGVVKKNPGTGNIGKMLGHVADMCDDAVPYLRELKELRKEVKDLRAKNAA